MTNGPAPPPPFAHVLVRLELFLIVRLRGRILRGEHKVAFPPRRFGGGRFLLLKEDALVPFPLRRFGGGRLLLLVIALLARLLWIASSSFLTELANAVIDGMVMIENGWPKMTKNLNFKNKNLKTFFHARARRFFPPSISFPPSTK